jgi:hypothetical protein
MLENNQISSASLILVIDVLDECERENNIRIILQLVFKIKNLNTILLRIFITSRSKILIRFDFRALSENIYQDFILHTISPVIIEYDISIFIRDELKKIKERRIFAPEWPGEQLIEILVQRAGSLFIYAATVCRFIGD